MVDQVLIMLVAPATDPVTFTTHKAHQMKKILAICFVILSFGTATQAFAGNCQHSSDTASDGSRCGDRSADARPGGN